MRILTILALATVILPIVARKRRRFGRANGNLLNFLRLFAANIA